MKKDTRETLTLTGTLIAGMSVSKTVSAIAESVATQNNASSWAIKLGAKLIGLYAGYVAAKGTYQVVDYVIGNVTKSEEVEADS
jgi:hypothetical protein